MFSVSDFICIITSDHVMHAFTIHHIDSRKNCRLVHSCYGAIKTEIACSLIGSLPRSGLVFKPMLGIEIILYKTATLEFCLSSHDYFIGGLACPIWDVQGLGFVELMGFYAMHIMVRDMI